MKKLIFILILTLSALGQEVELVSYTNTVFEKLRKVHIQFDTLLFFHTNRLDTISSEYNTRGVFNVSNPELPELVWFQDSAYEYIVNISIQSDTIIYLLSSYDVIDIY